MSLFIFRRGSDTTYLLLYVDDIVLTASSDGFLDRIISALQQEFAMKDLASLHHFLGISITRQNDGLFFSHSVSMPWTYLSMPGCLLVSHAAHRSTLTPSFPVLVTLWRIRLTITVWLEPCSI